MLKREGVTEDEVEMAIREHGLTVPVWRVHRHIGMGGDQLVAALAGQRVEDRQGDSIRAAETALYADLIGEVQPFADARRLMELLAGRGHRLVLASSGQRHDIEHYLELLKARDLVGYSVLQMLLHIPLVFFLCWLFAKYIPFVPPMK